MREDRLDKIVEEAVREVLGQLCPPSASPTACGIAIQHFLEAGANRVGSTLGIEGEVHREIARMIDHTLLKPNATKEEVIQLCEEAKTYCFASVCINPSYVTLASKELKGSPVRVCTVVGFPLGATTTRTKVYETDEAVYNGADEIDMVINVGALKAKDYRIVLEDIQGVVLAAHKCLVKVILETCLLNEEEKIAGCVLAKAAGADFVKTSTGFEKGGATLEDVALMRRMVGSDMGVKASGGVRSLEGAKKMIESGANRIGASASVAIVSGVGGSHVQSY